MSLKELVLGSALVLGGCATANPANESGNAVKPAAEDTLPENKIRDGEDIISYYDELYIETPFSKSYIFIEQGDCAITITDKIDYKHMMYDKEGHWQMLLDNSCDGTVDYAFFIIYGKKPIYQPRSSNPALFEKDFDSIFSELKQRIKGGNLK